MGGSHRLQKQRQIFSLGGRLNPRPFSPVASTLPSEPSHLGHSNNSFYIQNKQKREGAVAYWRNFIFVSRKGGASAKAYFFVSLIFCLSLAPARVHFFSFDQNRCHANSLFNSYTENQLSQIQYKFQKILIWLKLM